MARGVRSTKVVNSGNEMMTGGHHPNGKVNPQEFGDRGVTFEVSEQMMFKLHRGKY